LFLNLVLLGLYSLVQLFDFLLKIAHRSFDESVLTEQVHEGIQQLDVLVLGYSADPRFPLNLFERLTYLLLLFGSEYLLVINANYC